MGGDFPIKHSVCSCLQCCHSMSLSIAHGTDLARSPAFKAELMKNLLQKDAKIVAKALDRHPLGILLAMHKTGALVIKDIERKEIDVSNTGNQDKGWSEYLGAVKRYLKKEITDAEDARLGYGCDQLAYHIHDKHWNAFGYRKSDGSWQGTWPSLYDTQESGISIRMDQSYQWSGEMVIVVVSGDFVVCDAHPSRGVYQARCHGKPRMKYISFDKIALLKLERTAERLGEQAFLQRMRNKEADGKSAFCFG